MKKNAVLRSAHAWLLAALIVGSISSPAIGQGLERVDMLLHNGKVVTVDAANAIRSAVAVRDGLIVAVGDDSLVRRYTAPTVIDLKGRTVIPGLVDNHKHIQRIGRGQIDLFPIASIEEIQRHVAEKARELGPGKWISGYGWSEYELAEGRKPTLADIDAVAPDNPVALTRNGGGSVVGNSLALEAAGIAGDTPDRYNTIIERDDDGEITGVVRGTRNMLAEAVPQPTFEEIEENVIIDIKDMLRDGITSFIDAGISIDDEPVGAGGIPDGAAGAGLSWKNYNAIYARIGDELPRVIVNIAYPGKERLLAFPHATNHGNDRIKLGAIGELLQVDGGFTGPTAWTLEDYKGMPGFRGQRLISDDLMREMLDTAARKGWQLGLHAIGDAAIEYAVEEYARALDAHPGQDRRWYLSHFVMLPPVETMELMAAAGILVGAQPGYLYDLEGRYIDTLDGERLERINPVATPAIRHGLVVNFGTDSLPENPWIGLYVAVTRKGRSGRAYAPELEAVSRMDALRMATLNGAVMTFDEHKRGSIEVGKFADLAVLASDYLTIPAEDIKDMKVDLTIVGGKVVFDRRREEQAARAPS